jgi:lipopolysaccharide transport system ATP-binding protein
VTDTPAAIDARGVSKCYHLYERPEHRLMQAVVPRFRGLLPGLRGQFHREHWALRDVGFSVARGETVGIVGRNGSGKSTLLQIVCGTLAPTAGEVTTHGRIAALLELGSGFSPEFTGRENVYMNGALLGLSRAEVDARFDAIAGFADIGEFIDAPVRTYSSGMFVRLAFAVIAHVDADILVIDEALSVGDVFFSQKCMRFLRGFQEHGTVLFVSHDAASVVNLCDRAIWLDGGRVAMDGSAKSVCEAYHASRQGERVRMVAPEAGEAADAAGDDAQWFDHSTITALRFDPATHGFGDGRTRIREVRLETPDGQVASVIAGGERVVLRVEVDVIGGLDSPIIGFILKDRLGQYLFGCNTWSAGRPLPPVAPGEVLAGTFEFDMPALAGGHYTIDVAIADGTNHSHVQTAWLFDALALRSTNSTVGNGLVGIPFRGVTLSSLRP